MGQLLKLLGRMRTNPKAVSFNDLERVLKNAGFDCRWAGGGGSHKIFRHPSIPELPLSVPCHAHHVKEVYVKKAIALIDELGGIE